MSEETDQEYIAIVTATAQFVDTGRPSGIEHTDIGVVSCGLTRAQAEGVAFQLNDIFKNHSVPVEVRAQVQADIGRFKPK